MELKSGLVSIIIVFILLALGSGLYFAIDQLLALKAEVANAPAPGTGSGTGTAGTVDQNPFKWGRSQFT